MSKRGGTFARLGAGVLSLALALLLAELGLRVARPAFVALDRQPSIFRPDPALGYRFVPGSDGVLERREFRVAIHVNAAGFFDDEFSARREPGTRRLAVLGDSFVTGFQVGRGRSFPDVLEARLNAGAEGSAWEVMNLGMVGTATVQQARLLQDVLPAYEPDVVVLALYENDVEDVRQGLVLRDSYRGHALVYASPSQRPALVERVDAFEDATPAWVRRGVEQSFLFRALYSAWTRGDELTLLSNRVRADGLGSHDITEAEATAEIVELVTGMARACAEGGRGFLVLAIPSKEVAGGAAAPATGPILAELGARGISTLSLLDAFRERVGRGERLYWKHDGHCNATGYERIAAELHRRLVEDGLVGEGGAR